MNYFIETALAPAKLFDLAGDVESFKTWLRKIHNKTYDQEILTGHRFFLECAFTSIFHSIIYSEALPIKSDLLLELAANNSVSIDKLPGQDDRRIILKNLFQDYLQLIGTATESDLQKVINEVKKKIVDQLNQFYDNNFRLRKTLKLDRATFDNILLIDNLVTYYTQIGNGGPYAHQGALLHEYWVSKEKRTESFTGYKYVVQYLYSLVLPCDLYLKAEIDKMHQADSWRYYIINEQESDETDPLIRSLNETFDIEKQTCFESYLYRLNDLLNEEIPNRFGIPYTNPEAHLVPAKRKLPKAMFDILLDRAVKKYDVEQTPIEKGIITYNGTRLM